VRYCFDDRKVCIIPKGFYIGILEMHNLTRRPMLQNRTVSGMRSLSLVVQQCDAGSCSHTLSKTLYPINVQSDGV